ncbi:acyl-CoA/acyl-ACP dehydrogenase [Bradyrhizobium sp. Pear76]|uniref:acyl-CoA dehydrogenase family protein n=1 Tax=Bradyrhizobium oropedii TaxID=1571201 RepID=UPI001E5A6B8D|nr:acyl-CoA dehydrogenase family protein [Bradyrhizobium oropedii]MCC8963789.1 acyl-CoA/acyl-ACP dehydrogenase [Bradyrhizobium oropedii]
MSATHASGGVAASTDRNPNQDSSVRKRSPGSARAVDQISQLPCGDQDRLAASRAATNRATDFIRERRQFGKALKDFQAIQHSVVEMTTLTKGMELFFENAVQMQESGDDATQAISMTKYFCSEQLQRVVEIAVRVVGGRAYFEFEPVSRYYREAPFCLFAGGTVEIQKMLIARTLSI